MEIKRDSLGIEPKSPKRFNMANKCGCSSIELKVSIEGYRIFPLNRRFPVIRHICDSKQNHSIALIIQYRNAVQ